MQSIVITLLVSAALGSAAAAQTGPGPDRRRHTTIERTDTVALYDTIVRKRLVERREIVYRTETVIGNDSATIGESARLLESAGGRGVSLIESVRSVVEDTPATGPSIAVPVSPDTLSDVCPDTLVTVRPDPLVTVRPDTLVTVRPGGRYIWVPDSMAAAVGGMLSSAAGPASSELATFRGDTVPMVLRSRNFGRFDRGLSNHLFIPKGIWQIGATAAYGEFSTKDLDVLDLLTDIDFSGHIFQIKPYFAYFIGNNMSVGMRLGYTSGKADIDSFKVDIDEDMNFNLHDIEYRSESYSAALTFSQYYGIARRGRFGVYNEVELAFSSGNSDFTRPFNGVLKSTHTTTMQAALNFSPGVSVFIMEPVSFHVSFGVFGFSLRNDKQTVDGVDMGSRFTSGANFRFNIFNINFGVAINL